MKPGASAPGRALVKRHAAHEVGDSPENCRPFHGLDGFPKLTWGFAFGYTPGFTLTPASRA
jgi:hypothetical protein